MINGYFYRNDGKINVKRVILEAIKLTNLIAMAALAPNAVQSLKLLDGNKQRKDRRWYVDKTISKLIDQRLIKVKSYRDGRRFVTLTDRGRDLIKRYEIEAVKIPKPKRWDGKYRLVIFDIKEGKRRTRDELRRWLEQLGFFRLQNSVWIHPYECREVVVLLKSRLGVGSEVLYLTVDNVEDGYKLRQVFNL